MHVYCMLQDVKLSRYSFIECACSYVNKTGTDQNAGMCRLICTSEVCVKIRFSCDDAKISCVDMS